MSINRCCALKYISLMGLPLLCSVMTMSGFAQAKEHEIPIKATTACHSINQQCIAVPAKQLLDNKGAHSAHQPLQVKLRPQNVHHKNNVDVSKHEQLVAKKIKANPPVISQQSSKAVTTVGVWKTTSGVDLHNLLYAWTKRSGWNLSWNTDYDYKLSGAATFKGTFESAVYKLFNSMGELTPAVYIRLYPENKVLVVDYQPDN